MRQPGRYALSRAFDLSAFLARSLSNCHIDPKENRDEPNRTATEETEDEIRENVCGFASWLVAVSSSLDKLEIRLEIVSFSWRFALSYMKFIFKNHSIIPCNSARNWIDDSVRPY
jgi:hypothetical protein